MDVVSSSSSGGIELSAEIKTTATMATSQVTAGSTIDSHNTYKVQEKLLNGRAVNTFESAHEASAPAATDQLAFLGYQKRYPVVLKRRFRICKPQSNPGI